jgi:hypothetical protein
MKKVLANVLFAFPLLTGCATDKPADKTSASKPAATSAATTMDGWVSDKSCGAKVSAACAKRCAEGGVPLVVVNSADKSVIPVSNQESLKPFIAQHVTITGTMKDGSLTVISVQPVKEANKA